MGIRGEWDEAQGPTLKGACLKGLQNKSEDLFSKNTHKIPNFLQ